MTRQRDDDSLGATKRVPLTGLDVRRRDGLRTLEERLRILRRLSSDVWRQPRVTFGLRNVNIGIWKDALSVLSGQAADVIGMEVRDPNEVDALTGRHLWNFPMGQLLTASPITYSVDGKQYVAISAATSVFAFGLFEPAKSIPIIPERRQ